MLINIKLGVSFKKQNKNVATAYKRKTFTFLISQLTFLFGETFGRELSGQQIIHLGSRPVREMSC